MELALKHLYGVLDRRKVPAASALQPGLAGEAIERLMKRVPYSIPTQLAALYQWRNGTRPTTRSGELFPGGRFLPLADAIAAYQRFVDGARQATRDTDVEAVAVYDPHWFPVFVDRAGNPHVTILGEDPGAGSIWYVLIEDASDRRLAAADLKDFVETVARRWEKGAYYLDEPARIPMEDLPTIAAERRARQQPQVDVTALVNDLASTDGRARARSVRLLKEFLFPEALEPLLALLTHPSPAVRADAASLLGQLGDPKAIPSLLAAKGDRSSTVRAMVDWALGELGRR